MRSKLALVVVGFFALAAEEAGKDREKMQGSWTIESLEHDGKPAKDSKQYREVQFKGNQLIWKFADVDVSFANVLTLDETKKPKAFDMRDSESKETLLGIYELDGDKLQLCWSTNPKGPRPDTFATKADSGRRLLILKSKK